MKTQKENIKSQGWKITHKTIKSTTIATTMKNAISSRRTRNVTTKQPKNSRQTEVWHFNFSRKETFNFIHTIRLKSEPKGAKAN